MLRAVWTYSWCYWDSVLKQQPAFGLCPQGSYLQFISDFHIDDHWFLINVVVCCIFLSPFFSSFDSCFTFSLCNSGKPFVNFYLFFLFLSLSFSFKISLFFSRYLFCFSAFESFLSQAGFLPILLACNTISLTQTHFLFTCSTCSRSLCCTMLTFTRK